MTVQAREHDKNVVRMQHGRLHHGGKLRPDFIECVQLEQVFGVRGHAVGEHHAMLARFLA